MKKTILILLLFVGGCKTDWYEKGLKAEDQGDYAKAFECFQKGAQGNNCFCMSQLAGYYQFGLSDLDPDETKAFYWYQKAAEAGLLSAYIDVGKKYLYGKGIPQDTRKAIESFNLAINGTPWALFELGKMYYEGIGIERNYKIAYKYFNNAIERGCYDAKIYLAIMYAEGQYVNKDDDKVFEIFKTANDSEQDVREFFSFRLYNIGLEYLEGKTVYIKSDLLKYEDVPKDEQKAFKYIELAAEWGSDGASYTVAGMYENGLGVARNLDKAVYWYQKAGEAGVSPAKEKLKELTEEKN